MGTKVVKEPPEFPQSILVTIGTQSGDLYPAPTPSKLLERTEGLTTTVKIARYVLAGTGTIQHSAPVYVEDAKA